MSRHPTRTEAIARSWFCPPATNHPLAIVVVDKIEMAMDDIGVSERLADLTKRGSVMERVVCVKSPYCFARAKRKPLVQRVIHAAVGLADDL
ncbi:hypothetical protein MesoLjLa_19160 [Mesorhizobium sp. L-2-11]|nr:hypothetical protein MesoLjLa_19160 [Mesorhizobium sp. L-2-11]